jgi:uridine kinase
MPLLHSPGQVMHMVEQTHTITITTPEGLSTWVAGTPVRAIMPVGRSPEDLDYLGALVNNDVVSLSYRLEVDSSVSFLTRADSHGFRIFRRTVCFILAKAFRDVFPEARLTIEHSIGTGYYCTFSNFESHSGAVSQEGNRSLESPQMASDQHLEAISRRMHEIIDLDLAIDRRKISYTEAVRQFEAEGQWDKLNLLQFRNPPKVTICWCDGFSDLAHGPLADRTGCLNCFSLISYHTGFVLQFPERENPLVVPPFEPQEHLFQIFREHKEWGRILGIRTVGNLNEINARGEISDVIRIAEAFHEKKLALLADLLLSRRESIKWVLIAGPSSAGKTTFAKRLAVQLRVNGLRPVTISTDDYFLSRDETPRDEQGDYDFENIEAIDLELFNGHMNRLDRGEEVELPQFNFEKGIREWRGKKLRIAQDELVLVEGIHALNPRLTRSVPSLHKYRIYVSALTQLNLDLHNRVSTTDNRLMRRLVRDHKFRGHNALTTLKMWPSVRRGEKTWVFPFQREADIAFNTALDYELAVLKPMVEPLLFEVKPADQEYAEARRLLDFLASFLGAPNYLVPPTSILREFIGRSSFHY